ncbi:MAG: phosphoadenosine phosphosulfate reductase family protein, partial [Porticoccaceae bacterium]
MRALVNRLKRTKEAKSREFIREFLSRCKKPYLSWSGGKDSTLMLWLVLQERPDIPVIYFDADSCLPDGWEYMRRLIREWSINFRAVKTRPILDVLAEYGLDHPGIDYRTMEATVYEPVKQLISEGYDGSIIGIRSQESLGRTWAAKKYGPLFWN